MSLIRALTCQFDGLYVQVRRRCESCFLVLIAYVVRVKFWWSYKHFLCSGINEREIVTDQLLASKILAMKIR
jgi:hypothetical protein